MDNRIFVRPAVPSDGRNVALWSMNQPGFDPEVIKYPSTFTLCAFDQTGSVVYLPVQQAFILDTLAINPEADPKKQAVALRNLMQEIVMQMHIKGIGEVLFIGSDEKTNRYAEDHLFEKVEFPVYRLKLKDLEHPRASPKE